MVFALEWIKESRWYVVASVSSCLKPHTTDAYSKIGKYADSLTNYKFRSKKYSVLEALLTMLFI